LSLEVVVGMGVVAFLSLYMVFNLRNSVAESFTDKGGNKHFLLQLIFLFLFFGSLLFIGNATMKADGTVCSINYYVNGSGHGHPGEHYDYECYSTGNTQGNGFYRAVLWVVRLSMIYVVIYFVWETLKFLGWVVPRE